MMNVSNCTNAYSVRSILQKRGVAVVADNYTNVEASMLLEEIEVSPTLDVPPKAKIILDDIKVYYNGKKKVIIKRPPHLQACAFVEEGGGVIVSLERLADYRSAGIYTFAGVTVYLYGEISMDLIENIYIEGRGCL